MLLMYLTVRKNAFLFLESFSGLYFARGNCPTAPRLAVEIGVQRREGGDGVETREISVQLAKCSNVGAGEGFQTYILFQMR